MSWHCSAALVAEFLEACFSDGEQSAPLRSTLTAGECSCKDKTTECCLHSPFGMTCELLTDLTGAAEWTSSLRAFHASLGALQASDAAQATNGISGPKRSACFVKFDPDTRCWRTSVAYSLIGNGSKSLPITSSTLYLGKFGSVRGRVLDFLRTLREYLETWPKAGSMLDGACYRRLSWERRIAEIGYGSGPNSEGLWPSPVADGDRATNYAQGGMSLGYAARAMFPTPTDASKGGGTSRSGDRIGETPTLQGMARKGTWPTPRAEDARGGKSTTPGGARADGLAAQVRLWPTPSVCGNYNRKGASPTSGDGLQTRVGGQLNPTWVEWLMGWPLGWTDLKPLAKDKFRQWLEQHGSC